MSDNPPLPPYAEWPSFPFEGDLRLKSLDEPVEIEPSRHGENPADCLACTAPDENYIWVSERWRVRSLDHPTGLPVVLILEPRSHLDLGDLPNLLAAELGVMTVRVERAIRSLDGVARVHVSRWGDGAAHLHVWFLARPHGYLQLQGSFLSMWNDILPAVPEEPWRENLALAAAWLAEFGGTALAEPPRIHWTAPSRFETEQEAAAAAEGGAPAVMVKASTKDTARDTARAAGAGPSGPGEAIALPDPVAVLPPDAAAAPIAVRSAVPAPEPAADAPGAPADPGKALGTR